MTLSKDQKRYRKDKEDGKRNFRSTIREDGTRGVRVTYRKLCVRVNESAYDRLKTEAEQRGLSMGELLTRMINLGYPNYGSARGMGLEGYHWDKNLTKPDDWKKRFKGTRGDKMLTLKVTTTAWYKLECHHVQTGMSKARLVQDLILNWKFTPQHVLDKMKAYWAGQKAYYANLFPERNKRPQREKYAGPKRGSKRWLATCSIEELDAYYEEEEKKMQLMVERAGEYMGEPLKED